MARKYKFIVVLIFLFASVGLNANESHELWDSANAAYSKGAYTKAAMLYDSIIKDGRVAPELYFNLGNAYYKSNNIALAILNYERAVKMQPDNEDYNFNLKLANQRIEDKIDIAPQLFLTQWKNSLLNLMSESGWSLWCIVSIIIALVLFGLFITSYSSGLKQLGFFGGVLFICVGIASFFLAKNKYDNTINSSQAIVTAPSITVTGSPSDKGTKLFILHEGTKVNVSGEEDEWIEISIANGNTGWIKKTQLEKI